jgi:ABC-type bacteriocin/lantibiotic exporter with double-glycine peptidase domain
MLLLAYGKSPAFEEVVRYLPITEEKGVSLLELRNAAERLGLPCDVRRFNPTAEDLARCPLPVLLHLSKYYVNDSTGHYVLVYKVVPSGEANGVWFVDSLNGKKVRFRPEAMPDFWSGFVLVPKQSLTIAGTSIVAASGIFWILVAAAFLRFRHHRNRIETRAAAQSHNSAMCLAVLILCLISAPSSADPNIAEALPSSNKMWRTPERDSINCLYLILRLYGRETSNEKLESVLSDPSHVSLLSLAKTAESFGLPMDLQRVAPSDLASLPCPMIAYIYDIRQQGGRFEILYHVPQGRGEKFGAIDTGLVRLHEISEDEFRRTWSGLALIPARTGPDWYTSCTASSFLLAVYFWNRSRQRRTGSKFETVA